MDEGSLMPPHTQQTFPRWTGVLLVGYPASWPPIPSPPTPQPSPAHSDELVGLKPFSSQRHPQVPATHHSPLLEPAGAPPFLMSHHALFHPYTGGGRPGQSGKDFRRRGQRGPGPGSAQVGGAGVQSVHIEQGGQICRKRGAGAPPSGLPRACPEAWWRSSPPSSAPCRQCQIQSRHCARCALFQLFPAVQSPILRIRNLKFPGINLPNITRPAASPRLPLQNPCSFSTSPRGSKVAASKWGVPAPRAQGWLGEGCGGQRGYGGPML